MPRTPSAPWAPGRGREPGSAHLTREPELRDPRLSQHQKLRESQPTAAPGLLCTTLNFPTSASPGLSKGLQGPYSLAGTRGPRCTGGGQAAAHAPRGRRAQVSSPHAGDTASVLTQFSQCSGARKMTRRDRHLETSTVHAMWGQNGVW